MTVRGMRLRVHPLTPLMLALIYVLSGGQALIPSLIALGAHESAHLLLALRLRARVDEIELMPFGAAIRLYELWETSPGALIAIALAGPGMNLAAASLLALGLYAFPAEAFALIPLIRMNLAIGAVNLLPALPLDGGRALCALMALRMDRHRAVRIGVILGRVLAAGILLFAGFLCLSGERLQLGLVLSAVYILASGERERRQSEGATLRAMLLKPNAPETPAPVRWIAISETATVLDAVREMRPGHTHLFAVMNASGGVQTVLTQARVLAAVERDSTLPLSSLIA